MDSFNFTVQELLDGKIDKAYDDKVFWYASKVIIDENIVKVYIENNNLFTFDKINLDIKKISEFKDIKQQDSTYLKDILISSGTFLFINNKLAVTQRDFKTKFDPGFWTTPAGRCDRSILETGLKETIEEIEIDHNGKKLYPLVCKKFVDIKDNNKFYETSFSSDKFLLNNYEVSLYLDNVLIEECSAWMYVSEDVNTIEFRVPMFVSLDEGELTYINPEFGTHTGLKSIETLQKLDCVPALRQLIEEMKNGTRK